VLLSVDATYLIDAKNYGSASEKIFHKHEIDWPSVYLPGGWNDAARTFNLNGYGLVLVDSEGLVRKINPRGDELEAAVKEVLGEKKATR
jgi:hypothetical protein